MSRAGSVSSSDVRSASGGSQRDDSTPSNNRRGRKRQRSLDDEVKQRRSSSSNAEVEDAVCRNLAQEGIAVSPRGASFLHLAWRANVTVPFLARYRRDQTGGLSEVDLRRAMACFDAVTALRDRKDKILTHLARTGVNVTPQLKDAIAGAPTLSELEAVYEGCRVRQTTTMDAAAARGLLALAAAVTAQTDEVFLMPEQLRQFASLIPGDKELLRAVVAQHFYLHSEARTLTEDLMATRGCLTTSFTTRTNAAKAMTDSELAAAQEKYAAYANFSRPVREVRPHQFMAAYRGSEVGVLSIKVAFANEACSQFAQRAVRAVLAKSFGALRPNKVTETPRAVYRLVEEAADQAFLQHLVPHAVRVAKATLRQQAETSRVVCFSRNLRNRLLQRPLSLASTDVILAVDPGFAHGCKCVVLGCNGQVEHADIFYLPCVAAGRKMNSANHVKEILSRYCITLIVVGNGTGCRETTDFLRTVLQEALPRASGSFPSLYVVSEGGASVYSASAAATEELGELSILHRGAVSIGRRLIDPLSELVKIPPQAAGVGQYQHDAKERHLVKALEDEVGSCVAAVGVNFDTCSKFILEKIPGMSKSSAAKLMELRAETRRAAQDPSNNNAGGGLTRAALQKVMRTSKERQEAIAFIRLPSSPEPLDRTSLHPEAYGLARAAAAALGRQVGTDAAPLEVQDDLLQKLALQLRVDGIDQLRQAVAAISACAPSDPRLHNAAAGILRNESQKRLEELVVGEVLSGFVVSVADFAAFVDVGAEKDGFLPAATVTAAHGGKEQRQALSIHDFVAAGDSGKFVVASVDLRGRKLQLKLAQSTPS